jgi:hypothetical protein
MNPLRLTPIAAALVAVLGVAGVSPPVALAGSQPVPTWTKQHPATSPSARVYASIAYDAATGNVVLFGGADGLGDTWVWDGSAWTEQSPATSPPGRWGAAMAYDAATGNVVLFGGSNHYRNFGDTWVWDGSTWTKQHPATSPPARWNPAMAYDAATGDVVLFGGLAGRHPRVLGDTWVWDGSTWTRQHPATSPPARTNAAMTYDAATRNVVLLGGVGAGNTAMRGTWVWDGSTWTRQHPATSPPARWTPAMAYDAATGNVLLFGGYWGKHSRVLGDTWVWDGSTWTKLYPGTSPPARAEAAMAYDAATGKVVLFSGYAVHNYPRGTWVWGSASTAPAH